MVPVYPPVKRVPASLRAFVKHGKTITVSLQEFDMRSGTIDKDKDRTTYRILLQYITYNSGKSVKAITHFNRIAAQIVL